MHFTKMQGIGNDYIYINGFEQEVPDPGRLAKAISDRHFGAGSDGLVLILSDETADLRMRMFNSDGSESEMCGNASRCVAKYAYERGLVSKTELIMATGAGPIGLKLQVEDGKVLSVRVDMGEPILEAERIPVQAEAPQAGIPLTVAGEEYTAYCVSMGNPHCVVFVEDPGSLPLAAIGPLFENHPIFPRRTNTEFIQVIHPGEIRMRVWERGAGETWACGTGACGAVVAAVLSGRCQRRVLVHLLGGDLTVFWDPQTNHVYQEGPAEFVYEGEWPDA